MPEKLGFDSQQGEEILLSTKICSPALGPTQPPIWWAPGHLSQEVKQPGGLKRQRRNSEWVELYLYFHVRPHGVHRDDFTFTCAKLRRGNKRFWIIFHKGKGILEKTKFGLMRTNVVAVDTTWHWASSLKLMAKMVIVVVVSVTDIIIIPAGPNFFFFSKLPSRLWGPPSFLCNANRASFLR